MVSEEYIKEFLNSERLKIKLKNKYTFALIWKGLGENNRLAIKT
jgi:hypothetical protein